MIYQNMWCIKINEKMAVAILLENQARDVTYLTLNHTKIKCHRFKTLDSRHVPIVKIER